MEAVIRKVQQGDASNLAYIQTESWKAAFTSILDAETLTKCTNIERATSMYQRLLDENKGNGYLLTVDGKPHCIAYWDAARDVEFTGKAELICIHSLPNNWHKGYGSMMMNQVLKDIKESKSLWMLIPGICLVCSISAKRMSDSSFKKHSTPLSY